MNKRMGLILRCRMLYSSYSLTVDKLSLFSYTKSKTALPIDRRETHMKFPSPHDNLTPAFCYRYRLVYLCVLLVHELAASLFNCFLVYIYMIFIALFPLITRAISLEEL